MRTQKIGNTSQVPVVSSTRYRTQLSHQPQNQCSCSTLSLGNMSSIQQQQLGVCLPLDGSYWPVLSGRRWLCVPTSSSTPCIYIVPVVRTSRMDSFTPFIRQHPLFQLEGITSKQTESCHFDVDVHNEVFLTDQQGAIQWIMRYCHYIFLT